MRYYWKHGLLFCVCCALALGTFCQVVSIDWARDYGSYWPEETYDILVTPDSNILVVGAGWPIEGDFSDCGANGGFIAIKLDTLGNIIWSRCYGGSEYSVAQSVINTYDGGFILTGRTDANDGDVTGANGIADCWVVKLDAAGNLEWERAYGGSNYDIGNEIIELADGGYAVVCESLSTDGDVEGHHGVVTNSDAWVFTINTTGELIWSKCLGGSDDDYGYGIVQDAEDNLVIAGNSLSANGDVPENKGSSDVWVFKINADGDLIWSKTYGGSQTDNGNKVNILASSYYVVGETYSNDLDVSGNHSFRDAWVIKLNFNGELMMQKCFGGLWAEEFQDVGIGGENELFYTGISGSSDGDLNNHYGPYFYADHWVVGTDTLGNITWQKTLGGSLNDFGYSVVKLSSTTYVTTGFSYSSDFDVTENGGYSDIWTVKLSVCTSAFYADVDGDGYGNVLIDSIACSTPMGFVADSSDCNDTDNTVFPTALDICNTLDDNCNGIIDEDALFTTYYGDNDTDGYGDPVVDSVSCFEIIGFVNNNLDCNDADALINPAITELCNSIDDDCNGVTDDGLTIYTMYADTDGDTFGNPDTAIDTCVESISGYVSNGLDCNDTLNAIYPGAEEICNYLDDDCDGLIDDNLTYTWQYADADGDLFGNIASDTLACLDIPGYVTDSTDCNDMDANIFPGAMEILNGLDDDCDGLSDEGLNIPAVENIALNIYPIPATDFLIVELPYAASLPLQIINTTGSIVYNNPQWNNESILINYLPAGMYLVQVFVDDVVLQGAFVKE